MAFRIASILGLSCRPWLVLGAAETEKEFFPLSGGIDNGVQVTIKVKSIADGATIEFVNRERKPAFTFTVNKDSQPPTITRSADAAFNGAVVEDFGGFPAELSQAASEYTFIFTKRKFEMAVSIVNAAGDIIRYPWYDYANLRDESDAFPLLTHVTVNELFTDPEVTLERPACSKPCHPDECRQSNGMYACSAEEDCFSVEVGDAVGVATRCSPNKETTPGGSMHCCDGSEVTPKARTTLVADTWATMSSSSAYIQRVCTAFGAAACPTDLAGTNVKVTGQYGSDYELFTPGAISQKTDPPDWKFADLEPSPYANFSRFALFELFTNRQVTQALPQSFTAAEFNADSVHDNIYSAGAGSNLTKGMFVHLIEWTYPDVNQFASKMVTKYTRRVKDLLSVRSELSIVYASERPMTENPVCTSRRLVDANGEDCSAYVGLCSPSGYPTKEGCEKFDPDGTRPFPCRMPGGKFYAADAAEGNHSTSQNAAALACCECGGGDNVAPTNWGSNSASQLHVVM